MQGTDAPQHTKPAETLALDCIKRHLPTLKQVYAKAGSRQLRLALKEFEALVRDERPPEA